MVFRARDQRDAARYNSPRSFINRGGAIAPLLDLSMTGCAIPVGQITLTDDQPFTAILVLVWDDEQLELPITLIPVRTTDTLHGFRLSFSRPEFETILINYLEDLATGQTS